MKKNIEEIIIEKANNIYEKYYSDSPENVVNETIKDKANLVKDISFILKRTLVTPRRKRYLLDFFENKYLDDLEET